jgi:hypothetical protein
MGNATDFARKALEEAISARSQYEEGKLRESKESAERALGF